MQFLKSFCLGIGRCNVIHQVWTVNFMIVTRLLVMSSNFIYISNCTREDKSEVKKKLLFYNFTIYFCRKRLECCSCHSCSCHFLSQRGKLIEWRRSVVQNHLFHFDWLWKYVSLFSLKIRSFCLNSCTISRLLGWFWLGWQGLHGTACLQNTLLGWNHWFVCRKGQEASSQDSGRQTFRPGT